MAASFCSSCGKPVPAAAGFCPSCGSAVAARPSGPLPPGSGPAPIFPPGSWGPNPGFATGPPGFTPMMPAAPTPEIRRRDSEALRKIQVAAIIGLIGFGISASSLILFPVGTIASASTSGTGTNTTVHLSLNAGAFYALLGVGGALTLAMLAFYRIGLSTLAAHDPRFKTPADLTIVAMVGYVLLIAGVALLISALVNVVNTCTNAAGNATVTLSCLGASDFWYGIALLGVGGVIALVGFIGLLIGLWRVGTRFDNGLIHAGTILMIFPYLDLVGAILVIVGAQRARTRVESGIPSAPATF